MQMTGEGVGNEAGSSNDSILLFTSFWKAISRQHFKGSIAGWLNTVGSLKSGSEFGLYQLLGVWPWIRHCISLSVSLQAPVKWKESLSVMIIIRVKRDGDYKVLCIPEKEEDLKNLKNSCFNSLHILFLLGLFFFFQSLKKIPLTDLSRISTDMTLPTAYFGFLCYISGKDQGKVEVTSKGTPDCHLG